MTEEAKKEIMDRVSDLMELINSNVPAGYDTDINIRENSEITLTIRKWAEPDENGSYQGIARRDLLEAAFSGGEWSSDWSESWNEYYRKNGILLEERGA